MTRKIEVMLDLGLRHDGQPIQVPDSIFNTHADLIGPSGSGKSRALTKLVQEFVSKTDSSTVVIDPTGALVRPLTSWMYEHELDDRLVVIDPRERRRIIGINPLKPWPAALDVQASVIREIMRRSLGNETTTSAPLAAQWIYNSIFALLQARLTLAELPALLDFNDSSMRNAVIERLPDSPVKNDFRWLASLIKHSGQGQMLRVLSEQLGSTIRRMRQFATNGNLAQMLAGQANAIDWGQVIDRGDLVLVNLSLEENALTLEDQRLAGQLIICSLIGECFARPMARQRRAKLVVDEAGKFATPEVATILSEGRNYGLELILAHQGLSQLVDHTTKDPRLLDAVMNNAHLKIIFGGLGKRDADEIGATIFGHLCDPDKRKHEIKIPMQLSHVEERESVTEGKSLTRGNTEQWADTEIEGESEAEGFAVASGRGRSAQSGHVAGTGLSYPADFDGTIPGMYLETASDNSSEGESEQESESQSEVTGRFQASGQMDGGSESEARTRSRSRTRGSMVVPGEPFEVTTSIQYESLEEQQHRYVSHMIRLPRQHAVVVIHKEQPVEFRVADVPDPLISDENVRILDLRRMRRQGCYAEPKQIESEVAERQRALLASAAAEVEAVDTTAAIERRRTERKPSEVQSHDKAPIEILPTVKPRKVPGRGRKSATPPREESA